MPTYYRSRVAAARAVFDQLVTQRAGIPQLFIVPNHDSARVRYEVTPVTPVAGTWYGPFRNLNVWAATENLGVTHPDYVHVISCTSVTTPHGNESLAMCGKPLGDYRAAVAAGHVVGNYARNWATKGVTCPYCVAREID